MEETRSQVLIDHDANGIRRVDLDKHVIPRLRARRHCDTPRALARGARCDARLLLLPISPSRALAVSHSWLGKTSVVCAGRLPYLNARK